MIEQSSTFLLAAFGGIVLAAIGLAVVELRRLAQDSQTAYPFPSETPPRWLSLLARSVPQLPVEIARIRRDVSRAGFYDKLASTRILAWRNLLVWACIALTIAVMLNVPGSFSVILAAGVTITIVLYGVPGLWLNNKGNHRAAHILSSIPEVLDIFSMCLAGGLTLEQSLDRVADYSQNISPDIQKEFRLVRDQARVTTAGIALRKMADRFDEPELRSLAATVIHSERLGVDMRRSVDGLSISIRQALRSSAQSRANSMALKLLFPIVFCVMPPVFFVLVVPPILDLKAHFERDLLSPESEQILYDDVISTP